MIRFTVAAALFPMIVALSAHPSFGDISTFGASQDNSMFEANPNNSNGAGSSLFAGRTGFPQTRPENATSDWLDASSLGHSSGKLFHCERSRSRSANCVILPQFRVPLSQSAGERPSGEFAQG